MEKQMKILALAGIAVIIVAMTAVHSIPAYSQAAPGRGLDRREDPKVDTSKRKAEDKAYSETLSRIPSQEYDPWQNMRDKPANKPAPPKKPGR